MTTKQTRSKGHRRDRRRAKASNWTRQGKCNMGKRIGHGPGAAPQVELQTQISSSKVRVENGRLVVPQKVETKPSGKNDPTLKVPLGDFEDG